MSFPNCDGGCGKTTGQAGSWTCMECCNNKRENDFDKAIREELDGAEGIIDGSAEIWMLKQDNERLRKQVEELQANGVQASGCHGMWRIREGADGIECQDCGHFMTGESLSAMGFTRRHHDQRLADECQRLADELRGVYAENGKLYADNGRLRRELERVKR